MTIHLETARFILRPIQPEDADNLFQLDSDPEVMRYINGGKASSYELIVQKAIPLFLRFDPAFPYFRVWVALEKESREFMGWFHFILAGKHPTAMKLNLAAEDDITLGYRLRRQYWGQGYATEGSQFLIEKGFQEWGVQRVVAWALKANSASIGVMKKVGMSLEQEFDFTAEVLPSFPPDQRQGVKYGITRPAASGRVDAL